MWSAGCILYSLLSGSQAFNSDSNRSSLQASILHGNFLPMAGQRWRNISDKAYELLRKLLNIDAKLRPTAEQALADPWFTSDPFLVNEATMVMEGIKDQANVNGNSSHIINIPMGCICAARKAIPNEVEEDPTKYGVATEAKGEKRKFTSEENVMKPYHLTAKFKRQE